MRRTVQHIRETKSRDMVRTKIDSFFENGDAIFREWSERGYGNDAVVEFISKFVFMLPKTESSNSKELLMCTMTWKDDRT